MSTGSAGSAGQGSTVGRRRLTRTRYEYRIRRENWRNGLFHDARPQTAGLRSALGLNAARIYGVDVDATRTEISEDDVEALRTAFLHEPNHFPVPNRRRFEGPRTRRDFFKLLEYERTSKHG